MAIQTGQDKFNQALHDDGCDGKWTLRVNDPCNATKLDQIKTAIESQSSSSRYLQYLAGETISALKFVYVGPDGKIYLGDSALALKSEIVGITINAGGVDTLINVASFGPVFDATFAYGYSSSLFLTTMGSVSTTAPTVGFRAIVGKGLNDGQIFVDIDEVITL
jgi:hypothetical protein